MSYFVCTVIWPIVTSYYPWWLLFWHMLFLFPCCDLCTRGLQGYQTDKGNKVLKDLWIITLSEFFPTIKKVVTVEKAGGIYTPNPRGTFTLLPMHFYLISALSGLLIGLYSSTPNTITLYPHQFPLCQYYRRHCSVFALASQLKSRSRHAASPNRNPHTSAALPKVPGDSGVFHPLGYVPLARDRRPGILGLLS
jgi:hypothetical protein